LSKEEIQTIDDVIEAIASLTRGETPQRLYLKEADNHKVQKLVSATNFLIDSFSEANDREKKDRSGASKSTR
jgi:hypothetical protein